MKNTKLKCGDFHFIYMRVGDNGMRVDDNDQKINYRWPILTMYRVQFNDSCVIRISRL